MRPFNKKRSRMDEAEIDLEVLFDGVIALFERNDALEERLIDAEYTLAESGLSARHRLPWLAPIERNAQ